VPQEFKDPKFYALKHVVEILTAEDPRELVGQVRQRARFGCCTLLLLHGYSSHVWSWFNPQQHSCMWARSYTHSLQSSSR